MQKIVKFLLKFDEILTKFGQILPNLAIWLPQVRGNRNITSRTPENVYDALAKYSKDLTALAREGKLDPVIGRDDEAIRNHSLFF